MVNWVPSLYNPAQAVTVTAAGLIVPGSGNIYNGLIRAGNGVPSNQVGRVPGATSAAVLSVPAGAPRGLFDASNLLMPRFSFAWSPLGPKKVVVRGGFGSFHDRTQGNIIFSQTGYPPYSSSIQYQNGNLGIPSGGAAVAPAPQGTIHGMDPNLKVPLVYNFNFGIQSEIPWGMFLDVAYLGNLSRHQIHSPNINEPTLAALIANQALPSTGRPVTNSIVPYKGFSTINYFLSDANGNYNALQTYLTRRRGNTNFTVSYTWSKSLTEATGYNDAGDAIENGNRSYNYGPSNIDRRHLFVATYTYRIPIFRHSGRILRTAFAGWEVSGVTRIQSGPYLTPTGSNSIPGTRRSQYVGGVVALPSDQRGPDHWFNTAAFTNPPATALGNAGIGTIEGPGWNNWNVALRKVFKLGENPARTLRFTADTFNTFNHVNFDAPNVSTNSSSIGTISSSQPARNIQFGLRLTF
jgi:hypothetical protein